MDARFFRLTRLFLLVFGLSGALAWGASYETANFTVVNAPNPALAQRFCETAEQCRHDLALLWLGETLPNWSGKCPVKVRVGKFGAGGATTFIFQDGEVYGWEMDIQGSAERIIDSVLPHEITHMILASVIRQPIPRWLDEGAATSVEHPSEKANYRKMLLEFLRDDVRKGLPFNRMVALKDYPSDPMPFYAQGFSVVEYLLQIGTHRQLVDFAVAGLRSKDWNHAVREIYGIESLGALQLTWIDWVAKGSPTSSPGTGQIAVDSVSNPLPMPENPIVQVSANSQSAYGSAVSPIPVSADTQSQVVPIPSSYEVGRSSIVSSKAIVWTNREREIGVNRPDTSVRNNVSQEDRVRFDAPHSFSVSVLR